MRCLKAFHEGVKVDNPARQAVDLVDHNIIDLPCSKIQEEALELRPIQVGRREGGILIGSDIGPLLRFDVVEAALFVGDQGIKVRPLNLILCAHPVINHGVVPSL
jgi:hypothetical protein